LLAATTLFISCKQGTTPSEEAAPPLHRLLKYRNDNAANAADYEKFTAATKNSSVRPISGLR
jgi:hypothetical protein